MKLKAAFKVFLTFFVFLFSYTLVRAQTPVDVGFYDVTVNANITTDLYSQLYLSPSSVEIRQPSVVNIVALNPDGTAKPNRDIIIYINGASTGITISQPLPTDLFGQTTGSVSSTISSTYTVCAKDVSEVGIEILIADCEILTVVPVPVPVMVPEPAYTKGTSNIVMWNTSGSGVYQYYVEVSKDSSFNTVVSNSGWTTNLAHQFNNLDDGQMYFYRVKARNVYGGESAWSSSVYSVQDASGPTVEFIEVSDMGENTTQDWDPEYVIQLTYRIKDNVGIANREFWCLDGNGDRYDCEYTSVILGDFWKVSLKLKELDSYAYTLSSEYSFCVEATDLVNNVTRDCSARLEVGDGGEEPSPEPEEPSVPGPTIVQKVQKAIEDFLEDTVGKLDPVDLSKVTITTTAVNITVGFGILLSMLGNIPYLILQIILAILSLLGFRKSGKVSGYVYDSLTKEPIAQAVVRIFSESNELIWTDVTDSNGYFRTPEMPDAEYYIKVVARNYTFPSKVVFGKKDFPLEHVYHGESFLSKEGSIPNYSIPMDREKVGFITKFIGLFVTRTKSLWKSLHVFLFLFGFIFSIYVFRNTDLWWSSLVMILYIPALISLVFSLFNKRDRYGIVRDEKKNPIEGVILGLTEDEFGKLVSKRVSNEKGRYRFVVEKGLYSIAILNPEYRVEEGTKMSGLEVKKDGGTVLAPDIYVRKLDDTTGTDDVVEPLKDL